MDPLTTSQVFDSLTDAELLDIIKKDQLVEWCWYLSVDKQPTKNSIRKEYLA